MLLLVFEVPWGGLGRVHGICCDTGEKLALFVPNRKSLKSYRELPRRGAIEVRLFLKWACLKPLDMFRHHQFGHEE